MTDRRRFLQIGLGASAVSLAPVHAITSAVNPVLWPRPYKVLQDSRFPASANLVRAMRPVFAGSLPTVVSLEGDITRFWQQDLSRVWQQSPQVLAGVTGASVLFCLEQLARDHRLRVQWQQQVGIGKGTTGVGEPLVAWVIAPA